MREKLVTGIILFLGCSLNTWAFDTKLTSSETNIDINNHFTIKIDVSSEDIEDNTIKEVNIKGIENFNIVSRSQGQTTSTSISIIDGKAETISKSVNSIILTLSPKEEGEFQIGPAEVKGQSETKETNTLNITVSGKKIVQSGSQDFQEIIDNDSQKESVEELPDKYTIYFLIFGLLIILLAAIIAYYRQGKNNSIEIGEKSDRGQGEKDERNEKKEDFEEDKKLEYPLLDDKDFIIKLEGVVKSKISQKYNIKNIKNLQYDEILEKIDDNSIDKKSLIEIYEMINKLKYSNILISKAELLDIVKKF